MAGILTPTVRELWRAYIEKTREATSTIDTPLYRGLVRPLHKLHNDPYTDPLPIPPTTPYIETTSPTTRLPLH